MRKCLFLTSFVALLLPCAVSAAALNSTSTDKCAGIWQAADATNNADMTVTTSMVRSRLKVLLPENMKLPDTGGRTILLTEVDAHHFRATDRSGVVVSFTLKSRHSAYLSMKGYKPGTWSYIGEDLTRR